MSKLIIIILIIAVFNIGFIIISDVERVLESILNFKIEFLFPIFGFILLGALVKGVRQQFLLNTAGIKIPITKSILLHCAGYSLTLTPGGSGEFIKTYYLKKKFGYNISKSLPVFIVEKFYDFLSISIIIILLFFLLQISEIIIIIFIIILIGIILTVTTSKSFFKLSSKIFTKIPLFKKHITSLEDFQNSIKNIIKEKILVKISLSIFSFILYSIGIYLVFIGFNLDLDILFTTFVTFTSILFGYITFLPGGIGVTEISVVGFLTNEGINLSLATSIMLLLRLTGWWFLTIIGIISTKLFFK